MSFKKNLDCTKAGPANEFRPVYYACFAWKSLPSYFNAEIGPVSPSRPGVDCAALGWPTTKIQIRLARQSICDYVWAWSSRSGAYFYMSTGTPPPLNCLTPDMDLTQPTTNGTYWYVMNGSTAQGKCTYNKATKETKFEMSGVVEVDPGCTFPYRIWYEGI